VEALGGDPVPLLTERDPVLLGLRLHVLEKAELVARRRDRLLAIEIATLLSGEKLGPLEV